MTLGPDVCMNSCNVVIPIHLHTEYGCFTSETMWNAKHKVIGIEGQDCWWKPVIPATREVEIEGCQFEARSGKRLVRPCLKNKLGVVTLPCGSSCSGGVGRRM
jgi:hypothetical protein